VFPTISGNLLLARSKPRELNYIGFLHSKNTVEGRSPGSRRIDHAKHRAVCDRRRAPWASAMMLSQAFIRSTPFRRNSLLYRCRFFRPTLRLLSRKVCNIKLSRSRGSLHRNLSPIYGWIVFWRFLKNYDAGRAWQSLRILDRAPVILRSLFAAAVGDDRDLQIVGAAHNRFRVVLTKQSLVQTAS
jgi:hypothetical protein